MPRPLSNDLRARLIRTVESGLSARAAGRKLDSAPSTVTRLVKAWRDRGHYAALPQGGHLRSSLEPESAFIEQRVREHSDRSEAALNAQLRAERGLAVHDTTLGRYLRQHGWRYKKNGRGRRTPP